MTLLLSTLTKTTIIRQGEDLMIHPLLTTSITKFECGGKSAEGQPLSGMVMEDVITDHANRTVTIEGQIRMWRDRTRVFIRATMWMKDCPQFDQGDRGTVISIH
jgi:hypothetical protein